MLRKIEYKGLIPEDMRKAFGPGTVWFRVPRERQIEVGVWCLSTFGDGGGFEGRSPGERWVSSGTNFFVYEEDDAFSFRLRWC